MYSSMFSSHPQVGDAFNKPKAKEELQTIASSTSNVFRVDNFDALQVIRQNLEDKIFAIEGEDVRAF